METKPYNLQSPEQIAKDYGGNKQKIAEAMQMGILDPTAGTMAGMFIDRMRSAAQQEAAPQQTIAQQVMAPQPQMPMGAPPAPPAPAGLGATPQAAAMPPMGAAPPMGMVPPYASGGGLSDMPLPDGMFDEPSNGGFNDGYAGGGMVAFLEGGEVEDKNKKQYITTGEPAKIAADGTLVLEPQKAPENLGTQIMQGMEFQQPADLFARFKENVFGATNLADELSPRETKRAKQLEALLEEEMSPEALKARRKEDMWMALGQIGAKMATTPGSLLQAAGAGIGEALPGIAAAAKERRGAKRNLVKELLSEERLSNKELADRFNTSLDMVVKGIIPLEEAFQDRNFRDRWEKLGRESQERIANINAAAGIQSQRISTSGALTVADRQLAGQRIGAANAMADFVDKLLTVDGAYQGLLATNPAAASLYRSDLIRKNLDRQFGPGAVDFNDMNK
jgi:hypothetical protein